MTTPTPNTNIKITNTATEFEILFTDAYRCQSSISAEKFRGGKWRAIYRGAMAMNMCEPMSLNNTREEAIEAAKSFAKSRGWV